MKSCIRLFTAVAFFAILVLPLAAKDKKSSKTSKNAAKVEVPAWVTDSGRLQMFPRSEYMSVCAFGNTEDEAKSKAVAEITAGIEAQVQSNLDSTYSSEQEESGVVKTRRNMIQNISTTADNEIYQLEYTTPFYSESTGKYACTAFINRQKAFNFVKPKLDNAARIFPVEYQKAAETKGNFEKILVIKNAQKVLDDFYQVYDFAMTILPEQAMAYKSVDQLAVQADIDLGKLKNAVRFSVNVEGDYQEKILNKLWSVLTDSGYTVVKGKSEYQIEASVSCEISQNAEIFQAYPSVSYEVKKGGETKYTFSKKLKKVAGFDKDTVIRRSYNAMEKALENSL